MTGDDIAYDFRSRSRGSTRNMHRIDSGTYRVRSRNRKRTGLDGNESVVTTLSVGKADDEEELLCVEDLLEQHGNASHQRARSRGDHIDDAIASITMRNMEEVGI